MDDRSPSSTVWGWGRSNLRLRRAIRGHETSSVPLELPTQHILSPVLEGSCCFFVPFVDDLGWKLGLAFWRGCDFVNSYLLLPLRSRKSHTEEGSCVNLARSTQPPTEHVHTRRLAVHSVYFLAKFSVKPYQAISTKQEMRYKAHRAHSWPASRVGRRVSLLGRPT